MKKMMTNVIKWAEKLKVGPFLQKADLFYSLICKSATMMDAASGQPGLELDDMGLGRGAQIRTRLDASVPIAKMRAMDG